MLVTVLPPSSQPSPPPDPPPNKHFPVETLSPVKSPELPDPPDASVSIILLRIFVTSSRSSPQAPQILDLMLNLSRMSSKPSDGDAALVVTASCLFVSVLFMWYTGHVQVHLGSLLSGYPYSFEWDAMQDVWVIRALVGNVLMDSVSFGYIFMSLGCFYSAIECLLHITSFYSAVECSLPIASWFQIFLTSSAKLWFQILIITTIETNFNFPIIIGSVSWCHIASAILSFVETRGCLSNVDAAWDAKSRHCDIGGIFSGETTITLPNLCESRNHVSSALIAEAIAVRIVVYSNF
ncbi:hypothetical protein F2Q69_00054755 [Brassica cretica]|uniref:Uncharacterized protein n=1 Tax=Brassica cretica TaxID=69181 RepID=A0A8S9N0R9_BRACR|nr:hypothetical protein F2Q69_00054755 [Brassica cretica]